MGLYEDKKNRLLQFIGRIRRPVVSNLASADDAVAFKTQDETVFIAYLDSADGAEAKAFAGVAEKFREEFSFGVVLDPAVAAAEKTKSPSVVCYKVIDADTVHFTSFDEPEKLEGWLKEAARPVIGELTVQNQQRLLDVGTLPLPGAIFHFLLSLFPPRTGEQSNSLVEARLAHGLRFRPDAGGAG